MIVIKTNSSLDTNRIGEMMRTARPTAELQPNEAKWQVPGDVTVIVFKGLNFTYDEDGEFNGGVITEISIEAGFHDAEITFSPGDALDASDFTVSMIALRSGNITPYLELFEGKPQSYTGGGGIDYCQVLDWFLNTTDDQCNLGSGHDFCDAGYGSDLCRGEDGDDTIQLICDFVPGVINNDTCHGGKGQDTLLCTSATKFNGFLIDLRIFTAQDTGTDVHVLTGFEHITGSLGKDKFFGSKVANILSGMDGNDTLNGLGGKDVLNGGNGNDKIDGGTGDDKLTGGLGNDRIEGGAGDDDLKGGQGRDLFLFRPAFGTDTVVDFQQGIDKLGFSGLSLENLTIIGNGTRDIQVLSNFDVILLSFAEDTTLRPTDFLALGDF